MKLSKINTIPWQEMLRYSCFVLNIKPSEFWNLTMFEFMSLMQHDKNDEKPISRGELDQLIKKFE